MGAEDVAIVAITKHGAMLGSRLRDMLPGSTLHVPTKFAELAGPKAEAFEKPARAQLAELFRTRGALVVFISLGAVVRMLADQIRDKHTDPAVLVVDDRANFVISLLSGHLGGANALARRVAALMAAQPIITTASDVGETLAVDLLGSEFRWSIELEENVTKVSAAVVNEEPVGVVQEAGEVDWWPAERPFPPNITLYPDLTALARAPCSAALIITDRLLNQKYGELLRRSVIYRPKSLVIGIGCNRGTPSDEIREAAKSSLLEHGLSCASLRCLATIDIKRDEAGLLGYADKVRLPIQYYSRHELDAVEGMPNPSATVQKYTGTKGVCEPAAVLAARCCARGVEAANILVVPKVKSGNVTIAVARIPFGKAAP